MGESNKMPHLVLLSSPAHPIPVIELAKRIVTTHQSVKVTVFVSCFVDAAASVSKAIQSIPKTQLFNVIQLPAADISGLVEPGDFGLAGVIAGVRLTKPAFVSAISALETPPTALIVYAYAIECLNIADELKIPKYVYLSSHAWYLALMLYTPVLDKEVGGDYADNNKHPFVLPGCTPIRPEDLPDPIIAQTKKDYLEFLRIGLEFPKVDGILVNTWEELQPKTLAALRDDQLLGSIANAAIFPIGPIVSEGGAVGLKQGELFEWLDKQPSESVLYISFGSMGGLSLEQMRELAWGLELTKQRFIWVVRPPLAKTGSGSTPKFGHEAADVSTFFPEGFIARSRERGIVVQQWAPQMQVLSHPSCGGFMTHCGWNSAIECITNALPMIAWPLYAEQRMNATMLTEEFGIAVRSKTVPSKGVVGREEIAAMVRKVFEDEEEGKRLRSRVKQVRLSAEKAWSHGGSSYNALDEMVKHSQKGLQS